MEYPPFKGGVGNYYYNLIQNLTGYEVEIFQVEKSSFYKFFWPKWLKLFFQIKKMIKQKKPDLIWVGQVLPVGEAVYMIKKFFGIPYFVSAHGMDIMLPQQKLYKEKIMRRVLNVAQFITANSQFTKKELLNLGIPEGKIEIIYPCPNVSRGANNAERGKEEVNALKNKLKIQNKKVLLTVGRLVKRKGQAKVIEAMPKLLEQFPNLVYLIIGEGPESLNLKSFGLRMGVDNNVILLNNISNEELPAYYKSADLFVMPAVNLIGDVEGFGIVYLEAADFGLPAVAAKSGGVMEAIIDGQTGLLVEPDNQADLISKISRLLTDQSLYQKLSNEAKARVKKDYTWAKQAEKLNKKIMRLN